MSGSLTEAQKRIPSLNDVEQAAALLNIPGLDGGRNTGASLHVRQAALLDAIADWAALLAGAARETFGLDLDGITERYAYTIETIDEYDRDWWSAGSKGDSGGIEESPDSPETFALAVMNRYLDRIRDHLDDYEHLLTGEVHVRVSVWPVRSVTAAYPSTAPDPDNCSPTMFGHLLKAVKISPRAVEVRTPLQVHSHVHGGGITV